MKTKTFCWMILAAKHLCIGLLAVLLLTACSKEPEALTFHGSTMGTTYNITLPRLPEGHTVDQLQNRFDQLLQDINQEMSTYIPDSTISRFNLSNSTDWFPVSKAFIEVASAADNLSQLSNGGYDVTISPLIDLWGFGANSDLKDRVPDAASIEAAKQKSGYEKLELRQQPPAIRKAEASITLNFSSIAKGYGVDRLAEVLNSLNVSNYLVEIGGELRTLGKSPRGDSWRIAVERPDTAERSVQRVIAVGGLAVATSGDYRNYFERDGVRYSHTIDAATGRPVTHKLGSVTVLADTAMLADGWATALMVLGEAKGYSVAEQQKLAAYFIYKQDDGFTSRETPAFQTLTAESTQ